MTVEEVKSVLEKYLKAFNEAFDIKVVDGCIYGGMYKSKLEFKYLEVVGYGITVYPTVVEINNMWGKVQKPGWAASATVGSWVNGQADADVTDILDSLYPGEVCIAVTKAILGIKIARIQDKMTTDQLAEEIA